MIDDTIDLFGGEENVWWCQGHKAWLPVSDFTPSMATQHKSGRYCAACKRQIRAESYRKHRGRISRDYKTNLRTNLKQRLASTFGMNGQRLMDTVETLLESIEKGAHCVYCDVNLTLTNYSLDHIVPREMGGTDETANLQVICSTCNRAKGRRSHGEFLVWLSRLRRDEATA